MCILDAGRLLHLSWEVEVEPSLLIVSVFSVRLSMGNEQEWEECWKSGKIGKRVG